MTYMVTEKGRAAIAAFDAEIAAMSDGELHAHCMRDVIRERARGGLPAVRNIVAMIDLL